MSKHDDDDDEIEMFSPEDQERILIVAAMSDMDVWEFIQYATLLELERREKDLWKLANGIH